MSDIRKFANILAKAGLYLDASGYAWSWGDSASLGNGTTVDTSTPASVIGNHRFKNVEMGNGYAVGLDRAGYLWTWGNNPLGNLGDNSTSNKSSPVSVVGAKKFLSLFGGSGNVQKTLASDLDGYLWSWGAAPVGDGTTMDKSSPVSVLGGHKFVYVFNDTLGARALDQSGYAWGWGAANGSGQIGDNTITPKSSPVSVVGGKRFNKIITISAATGALDISGYAWCWGANNRGQLGIGSIGASNEKSSPTSVLGGHVFVDLVGRSENFMALDASSYAWGWGINANGALGDGTTLSRSSPVSVVGGRLFKNIFHNPQNSCVYGLDGSDYLWAWGINTRGQLGDGTTENKSSPVSVLGAKQWALIGFNTESTYGVDINGVGWAWGINTPVGTAARNSSPVSIVNSLIFNVMPPPFTATGASSPNIVAAAGNSDPIAINSYALDTVTPVLNNSFFYDSANWNKVVAFYSAPDIGYGPRRKTVEFTGTPLTGNFVAENFDSAFPGNTHSFGLDKVAIVNTPDNYLLVSPADIDWANSTATVTAAPLAQNGGGISISNVTYSALDVAWLPSTGTGAVQYKLVKATSLAALDTIYEANAISGADFILDWTAATYSATVTGLSASTKYYFAVLSKDSTGTYLYPIVSQTTSAPPSGVDDQNSQFTIPFSFKFFGADYGNNANGGVYLGTNSYVTFGFGSNVYSGISASNPGRGILVNVTDNWQFNFTGNAYFSTAVVNGVTVARVTYDGGRLSSYSDLIYWQMDFFPNQKINLRLSAQTAGGISGISNGSSFAPTFTTPANTNYVLESDNNGNNWTVNTGQYSPP